MLTLLAAADPLRTATVVAIFAVAIGVLILLRWAISRLVDPRLGRSNWCNFDEPYIERMMADRARSDRKRLDTSHLRRRRRWPPWRR